MFNNYIPLTSIDQPSWRNSQEIGQAAYEHEKYLYMLEDGTEEGVSFQNWVVQVARSIWGKDSD